MKRREFLKLAAMVAASPLAVTLDKDKDNEDVFVCEFYLDAYFDKYRSGSVDEFIDRECKMYEEGMRVAVEKAGKEIKRIETVKFGKKAIEASKGERYIVHHIRLIGHLKR